MFYTNVLYKDNRIFFKGYEDDGKPICGSKEYSPYIFRETDDVTEFKAFYNPNQNLTKRTFINSDELKKFLNSTNETLHGIGFTKNDVDRKDFAYQFIADTFNGDVAYREELIKIITIDIETESDVFPNIDNPTQKILAITASVKVNKDISYITFGIHEYDNFNEIHPEKKYVTCNDEEDLLKKFLKFIQKESPDILSGYNSNGFDFPYIISRIETAYKKEWLKKLSPFGLLPRKYQVQNKFASGKKNTAYEIYGVSMLDWLELYRKFTYVTRDSYTLNNIASIELGEKKIDYGEYKSLHDLYKYNWKKFIDYNIHDTILEQSITT